MRAEELAEELADFWLSAVVDAGWDQRLAILREIHTQLLADLETRAEYDAVSVRFVAALIERLGAPAVGCGAQAEIYATSANPQHQDLARAWTHRDPQSPAGSNTFVRDDRRQPTPKPNAFVRDDRRQSPRRAMDIASEIWIQGRSAPCRMLDLSSGGARIVVRQPAPAPGTVVRLVVPGNDVRTATVVFRKDAGIGLQFAHQLAS